MKVVVFNGSPRPKGDTATMVAKFVEAAEQAGHDVQVFNVAKMNIDGCKACEYCHTRGNGQCIQKDDMVELYPALEDAEALILASPIYYFTMSAQIEAPIHRFYNMGTLPNVKKMAAILSSYSPNVYDAAKCQLRDMANYMGAEVAGVVTSKNDEHGTDSKLEEVAELARSL